MTPEEHIEAAEELLRTLDNPGLAFEWAKLLCYRAEIHCYVAQVKEDLEIP